MYRNKHGFTLVELVMVMAVFTVIIMITGSAFKTILTQTSKLTKTDESNIEGMVGLEMFRHDLQAIGYGLPTSFQYDIQYPEAATAPANTLNDGNGTAVAAVPRAIAATNNMASIAATSGGASPITTNIIAGTDYLALKGTSLAVNQASQRWTYMTNIAGTKAAKIWPDGGNLEDGQNPVIVLNRDVAGVSQLVFKQGGAATSIYWARFDDDGFAKPEFDPAPGTVHYVYGIRDQEGTGLRMPFNRVDYFVARPTAANAMPMVCAPPTGILYKGGVNHADGRLDYIPLLDCVRDMQVVFGWDLVDESGNLKDDSQGDDSIDTYSTPIGVFGVPTAVAQAASSSYSASSADVAAALSNPTTLRKRLKQIRIYILAQVGKVDTNYNNTEKYVLCDPTTEGFSESSCSVYNLATAHPDMRTYHWKIYRFTVSPKNLMAN